MLANIRSLLLVFLLFTFVFSAHAEDRTPPRSKSGEPVFHARDLLSEKLLSGPDYKIDDRVTLPDDRYLFILRTSDGPIEAHGTAMLQVRIDEMKAIERATALDAENQEMEGVKQSFKETGQGLKGLLTDPGHTLGGIPKGLGRKVKTMTKGENETRRQFAVAVGCDPETDNPPLKQLLDKLALRRSIGKGAVAVGGFALTAGAANTAMLVRGASAMQTTAEMNNALASTPLYKINEQIRDELTGMGVPRATAEEFVEQKNMTTVQRMLFMVQYRRIHKVPGSATLIKKAIETGDRSESLAVIQTVELLAQLHERRPLVRILASRQALAEMGDGPLVWVSDADLLTDSPALRKQALALREQYPQKSLAILIGGEASPEARKTLESVRLQVIEKGAVEQVASDGRR